MVLALCSPPAVLCADGTPKGTVAADNPLCSLGDPPQRLPLSRCGVAKPQCDAAEGLFHRSPVGHCEGLTAESGLFQQPDKVQPQLGPLYWFLCVFSPAEALCDVKAEEPVAVSLLPSVPLMESGDGGGAFLGKSRMSSLVLSTLNKSLSSP